MESTILVKRNEFTDLSTIGDLFFDNDFICYTLEDTVRKDGLKIDGQTAIPHGRYEVAVSYSNRFKQFLPLVLNVPNFQGVRIHPGNTAADTEGCILVGFSKAPNTVLESRMAFNVLFKRLQEALKNRKVFLEIA